MKKYIFINIILSLIVIFFFVEICFANNLIINGVDNYISFQDDGNNENDNEEQETNTNNNNNENSNENEEKQNNGEEINIYGNDNSEDEYDKQDTYPAGKEASAYSLKQIKSKHFIIVYPEGWYDIAEKCGVIAENAYIEVTNEVGYAPKGRIHLIIDPFEETANGYAIPPLKIIRIYLNKPDLTSTIDMYLDEWLDKLITHELLHIVHLGSDNTFKSDNMLMPIPNFLVEGYAVYVETKLTPGGRLGSSLGDMFMRAIVKSNHFPGIDEAATRASAVSTWPYGNISYVVGSYFFKFLEETYGEEAIRYFNKLNHKNFIMPWVELNSRKAFGGKNLTQLWDNFKEWSIEKFLPQIETIEKDETKTYYTGNIGYVQTSIATNKASDSIFYREYDPDYLPALLSYNEKKGSRKKLEMAFYSGDFNLSKNGEYLIYSLKKNNTFYTHLISDLYLYDVSKRKSKRITHGEWASNGDLSPDKTQFVYVENNIGGTKIVLRDYDGKNKKIIIDGGIDIQYIHPKYSNDGKWIVFIKVDNESNRTIMLYNTLSKQLKELITLTGISFSKAEWSEDDSHLILSADRSGVFNIYLLNIETKLMSRVSNLMTGAFNPIQKGDKIYFSCYTNHGYELRHISYTKALEYEKQSKEWTYYNTVKDEQEVETPFGTGEKGLRDVNATSGYEQKSASEIGFSAEKNYNFLSNLKSIIPIIYLEPSLFLSDNKMVIGLNLPLLDVTLRHTLDIGISVTVPFDGDNDYNDILSPFEIPGFNFFYTFDFYLEFDLGFSTQPMIYSDDDNKYFGRYYQIIAGAGFPFRGKHYDHYFIGLFSNITFYDKGDIDSYPIRLNVRLPFLITVSAFTPIRGFRPVSGFWWEFRPGFRMEFESGEYVFYMRNINKANIPLFLPDSVLSFRLAIGYADPPIDPMFSTNNNTFNLRSGPDTYLTGNRMFSFSIEASTRLFRLDRAIYPIPILFKGAYATVLFDVAGGIYSNLPDDILDAICLGTGVEIVFEFRVSDNLDLDITFYAYIDPLNFDFTDIDTYNLGFRMSMPLIIF
jgi:Tol biopolymer transport system component